MIAMIEKKTIQEFVGSIGKIGIEVILLTLLYFN